MAVAKLDIRDLSWDTDGFLASGGKIWTYAANTTTPQATYNSPEGNVANTNPIIADSSGQCHIYLSDSVAYDLLYLEADDTEFYSARGVFVSSGGEVVISTAYECGFYFLGGPPTASQEIFRYNFVRDVAFPANFAGSEGSGPTGSPSASFVASIKKDGASVGTLTISTGNAYTIASDGGVAVNFPTGSVLTVVAPATPVTGLVGISATFCGTVA